MSKLTEPMIIARAKSSDLNTIKKLNCWGNELTDVSLVQRMPNVEVLALSVNNISSLADFRCCSKLRELYMRKNSISELNEVCYLQDCANLQNLTLTENPCTNFEGYRLAVIRALPRLQKLDDVEVTDEERRNALRQGVDLVHPEDEDCQYQVPSYPSQEHNGYSNGIKYESDEPTWEESIEEAPAEPNGRQSSPEVSNEVLVAHKMSPDQTPPEMESPEPPRQYHDEYADRRNANYNNSEHSGYSQRRDSTQSYHSTGQSYQQQQSYQDEDYYYRSQQQPRQRFHHPSSMQQHPPSVPITGNGRPKSRTSNILSAVLCLLKELDYQSLEVVDNTVNARMNELMHEHNA
ncbi:cilia- and flagella-associated protein 410 isoform X7 [Neocloeon triangulifer]|uniref:cilia- and flagella-associated protein 410 isoform X7 n=1 Tax=Neocloeon triangulifer TaxID=2078957 RepID=UPI00286F76E6|nr:cilia- and flagella-associated protein 410 isoform X7 [Neocloeon triangulifer]